MYCVYCGREIMDNMAFCDKCGKPVRKIQSDEANSDVCSSTEQIINDVDPNETYTERPLSVCRQIGVMIFGKGTYNNKILSPQSDGIYWIDFPENKDCSAKELGIRFKTDNGEWYFAESSNYNISHLRETDNCLNTYIREYDDPKMNEYKLTVRGEHLLTLIIYEPEKYDVIQEDYDLDVLGEITVGRGSDNMIVYDYRNRHIVSDKHAVISYKDGNAVFRDLNSANGSYKDTQRIRGEIILAENDAIDIFGLHLTYKNNILTATYRKERADAKHEQ